MDTQKEFNFYDDVISHATTSKYIPLSIKMRPQHLDEIVGQEHILGKDCLLPKLIKSGNFSSILFYGTPGCGKTTLLNCRDRLFLSSHSLRPFSSTSSILIIC